MIQGREVTAMRKVQVMPQRTPGSSSAELGNTRVCGECCVRGRFSKVWV